MSLSKHVHAVTKFVIIQGTEDNWAADTRPFALTNMSQKIRANQDNYKSGCPDFQGSVATQRPSIIWAQLQLRPTTEQSNIVIANIIMLISVMNLWIRIKYGLTYELT